MLATHTRCSYHDRLFHDLPAAALKWGNATRNEILWMLMMAVIGFGVMVPIAGLLAVAWPSEKHGHHYHAHHSLRVVRLYPAAGFRQSSAGIRVLLLGLRPDGADLRPMGRCWNFRRKCAIPAHRFPAMYHRFWTSVAPYIAAWLPKPLRAGGGKGVYWRQWRR